MVDGWLGGVETEESPGLMQRSYMFEIMSDKCFELCRGGTELFCKIFSQ